MSQRGDVKSVVRWTIQGNSPWKENNQSFSDEEALQIMKELDATRVNKEKFKQEKQHIWIDAYFDRLSIISFDCI